MKKLLMVEFAIGLLLPLAAAAQSDFDGTWKIDLSKTVPAAEPEIFLLENGMYHCKTCVPKIDIKADGQDQSVAGSPYYDAISVIVVDDRSIEQTEKKNGKTVRKTKMIVSGDGNSATVEFTDNTTTNADPITGKLLLTRPPKAKHPPAGAHVISGTWKLSKMTDFSDNALTFTFKVEDNTLTMTNPTGPSYTAKMDGTETPYKGDAGIDSVSVLRLGEHTFVETDKRGGKAVRNTRVMMLPETTKTIDLIVNDNIRNTTVLFVAERQ